MSDELLQLALEAHGGLERWRKVKRLDARLTLAGYLFELKRHPAGLRSVSVQVDTRSPRVQIAPFPERGARGIFESDVARIQSDSGVIVSQLEHPRRSYEGHQRITPWNDLQMLYFCSYVAWNYLMLPFLLVHSTCEEVGCHSNGTETWRMLRATFPDSVPTHCTEQTFYFDSDGMLRRYDYTTDIARGSAAQFCFDAREFDGFFFPTRSRVVSRDRGAYARQSGPSSIWIELESLAVTLE
jgi:hypothetical protein